MGDLKSVEWDVAELEKAVQSGNVDLGEQLLSKLKLALIRLPALGAGGPEDTPTARLELLLARSVFEQAILLSITAGDLEAFQRAWSQLAPFYTDASLREKLPPSGLRSHLTALNLLRLLTISAPVEFHCELELLPDEILSAAEVQQVIELEAWLMEGSYNRVLAAKDTLSGMSHASFFLSKLADTVREEVAACSKLAYGSLSTGEALEVLRLDTEAQLEETAAEQGWRIEAGRVTFNNEAEDEAAATPERTAAIPSSDLIANCLLYAKELERIV